MSLLLAKHAAVAACAHSDQVKQVLLLPLGGVSRMSISFTLKDLKDVLTTDRAHANELAEYIADPLRILHLPTLSTVLRVGHQKQRLLSNTFLR